MLRNVASEIVFRLNAIRNCRKNGNIEWEEKHTEHLKLFCQRYLPYGSGIDSTVNDKFNGLMLDESDDTKICIGISYHHMNDVGYYTSWTDHVIIVKPTFTGFDIRVTGRDRNVIKGYLAELYHDGLSHRIEECAT